MKVKYLVIAVDGVLTDGKVYMNGDGHVTKAFSVRDRERIRALPRMGIIPIIITMGSEACDISWCASAGVKDEHIWEVGQFASDDVFSHLAKEQIPIGEVVFIVSDIFNLDSMKEILKKNKVVCPLDAEDAVKEAATFVCNRKGGDGVIPEVIHWLQKFGAIA